MELHFRQVRLSEYSTQFCTTVWTGMHSPAAAARVLEGPQATQLFITVGDNFTQANAVALGWTAQVPPRTKNPSMQVEQIDPLAYSAQLAIVPCVQRVSSSL